MDRRAFVWIAGIAPFSRGARAQNGPVIARVVAASDLKFALVELAERFASQTGNMVQLTMGSSGSFAQQIRQGLPVDLFMSADEEYVHQLADAGLTRDRGVAYAVGRIVLFAANDSRVSLEALLAGVRSATDVIRHFAIANPLHAPYGRAARQALERLGLWDSLQPRLVLGENIAQATQFLTTGSAEAGITAYSLAMSPEVAAHGRYRVVPSTLHAPLRQRMVLLKTADPRAAAFYEYLQAPAARAVLQRHGFAAP